MVLMRQILCQLWISNDYSICVKRISNTQLSICRFFHTKFVDMQNHTKSLIFYKRLEYYRFDRIDKPNVILKTSLISRYPILQCYNFITFHMTINIVSIFDAIPCECNTELFILDRFVAPKMSLIASKSLILRSVTLNLNQNHCIRNGDY